MSHFSFLQAEWPAVHEAATKAEATAYPDARTSCFHARRALELTVAWFYKGCGGTLLAVLLFQTPRD